MKPHLSIVLVNWNSLQHLLPCLDSLRAAALGEWAEVIVVDNGSSDGSPEAVVARFPEVRLLINSENLGFARACNQGIGLARGEVFALLNPDTLVPPGALEHLQRCLLADPRIAAVGPALRNLDGSMQRSAWPAYPGLGMALADALFLWKYPCLPFVSALEYPLSANGELRDVAHLLGACLLIRRDAWESIGPLDEGFFLFLEETDWCLRAARAGWRIAYEPTVSVTHVGQHSARQVPPFSLPHYYRSYCRFVRKHEHSSAVRIALLKSAFGIAAFFRIGLWTLRTWPDGSTQRGQQARRMRAGYLRVLAELPTY